MTYTTYDDKVATRDTPPADPEARRVLLAAPRGYCAGVDRAVAAVDQALERWGPPIYVRGQIVHNRHVVADLAARGAVFVEDLDEVPPGERVVFSAHGVSPSVRQAAQTRELTVIDATCPLVTKVHKEAVRFAADGCTILLIGHEGHEEVVGTAGEAPDQITVIDSPDAAATVQVTDPNKVVWLSQTTLSVDEAAKTVAALRARFPALADPPSDDICYATQNRQAAVKLIAQEADLVIVVGSANSSNSMRLVEVAHESGTPQARRIDNATEINPTWLNGVTTIGLSSGASVPEHLVTDVLNRLATLGFPRVEEVVTTKETLAFAPPRVK